jgi:hypothetical protein
MATRLERNYAHVRRKFWRRLQSWRPGKSDSMFFERLDRFSLEGERLRKELKKRGIAIDESL